MKDFLIVGQGIAGSLLAYELLKLGMEIDIVDEPNHNSSSLVAAGLYNPVTGRKMVKTWNCDNLFEGLETYYRDLGSALGIQCLKDIGIYRPFLSISEQNDWQGKIQDPAYQRIVKQLSSKSSADEVVNDPYGGLLLQKSGYLNLKHLLSAMSDYFRNKGILKSELLNTQELVGDQVTFSDEVYRGVVFCDGSRATKNPWFDWLPWRPVKGEILDVQIENYHRENILNRGVFLIPLEDGSFRLGATYDNHNINLSPTNTAVKNLSDKLNLIFSKKFSIIQHKVGIRPATKDRKPIIGAHPKEPRVSVFNGFGAKGVSLVPYYSQQFAQYLVDKKPLDDEVNISRFFSLI